MPDLTELELMCPGEQYPLKMIYIGRVKKSSKTYYRYKCVGCGSEKWVFWRTYFWSSKDDHIDWIIPDDDMLE